MKKSCKDCHAASTSGCELGHDTKSGGSLFLPRIPLVECPKPMTKRTMSNHVRAKLKIYAGVGK